MGGRDAWSAEVLERLPEDVAASAPFVVDDLGGILAFYTHTHLPSDTLLGLTAKETGNAQKGAAKRGACGAGVTWNAALDRNLLSQVRSACV